MSLSASDPLSIRQLEVFASLLDQGSFTKAARHLGLSQSTVSGHVADLERRLGVRLVERERGGVRPTAAGTALAQPAREVLRAERTARMAVEELSGLLRGSLHLAASTIPASYMMPALLGRFHAAYPGVALHVLTGDSRETLRKVRAADAEIGVVGIAVKGSDLEVRPMGTDRLVLICSPDHPLASRKSLVGKDLADCSFVMREDGSGTRAAAERALAQIAGAPTPDEMNLTCELGSTEAVKSAVRAGLGVALISELAARDDVAAGVLASPTVKGISGEREFHVVHRRRGMLSPAARAFLELAAG